MSIGMFISSFIIAFIYGWVMTLVVLATMPVLALGGTVFAFAAAKKERRF